MVRSGEEAEKFQLLTFEFMSEESDPDDSGAMAVHQPQWRSKSNSLCSFILVLLTLFFLTDF